MWAEGGGWGDLGEGGVWAHAEAEDDDVCGQAAPVLQDHVAAQRPGRRRLETRDAGVGEHLDAVLLELDLQLRGHLGVEGRHDLREALHERNLHAAVLELLGHFYADEPCPADDGLFG